MKNAVVALLSLSLGFGIATEAQAGSRNIDLKTGYGDQFTVQNGWFGRKQTEIHDRAGDRYAKKKGLFGSEETNINLLGNQYKKKKGWFGSRETEVSTMFGDKVTTRKGWFGREKKEYDLSGMTSIVQGFIARKKAPTPVSNSLVDPNDFNSAAPAGGNGASDGGLDLNQ